MFNKYPYTDNHELNADWILSEVKNISKKVDTLKLSLESDLGYVTPDEYSGTDIEKLQKCIDDNLKNPKPIVLNRTYDITGYSIYINKGQTAELDHRFPTIIMGGKIIKNDNGFVFTSITNNTSDIYLSNVYIESVSGAGTTVFNGDTMIRLHTLNCMYVNVDGIIKNTAEDSYIQSCRFINDTVTGGKGYVYDMHGCYDTVIDNVTIESRESGIIVRGIGYYGMARNLNIINCVIEGLSDTAISIKYGLNVLISGCYFEKNTVKNIELIESQYSISIKSCLLEGGVEGVSDTLIVANGRQRFVNIENCCTLNGRIIDASNVISDSITFNDNRTVMPNLGLDHLFNVKDTVIKGFIDVSIPSVTITTGYADITAYKPDGNIQFALIKGWRSSTYDTSFNVTATGNYVIGTSGDTITDLEIRYFYI